MSIFKSKIYTTVFSKINSSQTVENWQVISHKLSLFWRRFQHPQRLLYPARTINIQSSAKDFIQFPRVTSFLQTKVATRGDTHFFTSLLDPKHHQKWKVFVYQAHLSIMHVWIIRCSYFGWQKHWWVDKVKNTWCGKYWAKSRTERKNQLTPLLHCLIIKHSHSAAPLLPLKYSYVHRESSKYPKQEKKGEKASVKR